MGVLSRSLFGFALIAWLPLCITFVSLLLAPSSPEASYAQLQRTIVIGFGVATAAGLLAMVWSYRLDQANSSRVAALTHSFVGRRWLALVLLIVFIELNIMAQALLRDIAPSITGPARFLLICWSLVGGGLLLTLHWQGVRRRFLRYRDALALAGIALTTFVIIVPMLVVTGRLATATGLQDRLRGGLDYRLLRFIDDGETPTPQEFWEEQGQTRVRWLPYSYWVVAPYESELINVNEIGLRRTLSFAADQNAPRIYFFGGSTAWGEGARDAYTIPSQVARLLADQGAPAAVTNYAQTGYVSAQDLILFQRQLALGNQPDLAVFYQGFNDIYSAYLQGKAGLPLRESQRLDDSEAGRLLRQGQPLLRPLNSSVSAVDWRLVTAGGNGPGEIVDNWLGNRRLIRAAARDYGVSVLFVWQPALFAKIELSYFEAQVAAEIDRAFPGFLELYEEVDGRIRELGADGAMEDLIILSDLFGSYSDEIFFDEAHINEVGNSLVAEALVDTIAERLNAR